MNAKAKARTKAASKAQTINEVDNQVAGNLIPAVAYLRMSSDQQEASIEQQRLEVCLLAKLHGYRIIREYVDSGLSGSKDIAKRTGFLKMIADSNARDFQAILCWDMQRFGRMHPLKAAGYKDTLRTNGVHLHTCKEGVIKWDSFVENVMDSVYTGAAHEYSKSLSLDTIRGRLDMLARGEYPNGKVPYGYDKLYVSPEGREYPVKRSQTFAKGKGWKRFLVVNEEEAATVRFIFREYVDKDTSMREIARQIHVSRPKGDDACWTKDTIKATLTNKTYCGFAHIGGLRNRLRAKEVHNRFGYHECAGAVPAIVSLEDWQVAVAKIAKNKELNRKVHPTKSSPLSGVLYCGHCGYALDKHSRADRDGSRYSYFTCSSAIKRPALRCHQWRVREDEILPFVLKHLVTEVDRSLLESHQAKQGQSIKDDDKGNLEVKLAALVARIAQADDEVLGQPSGARKDRWLAKIKEWESEQEILERQIQNLTISDGNVTAFAKWWQEMRDQLLIWVIPPDLDESDRSNMALGFLRHARCDDEEKKRRQVLFTQPTKEGIESFAEQLNSTPEKVAKNVYQAREAIPAIKTLGNPGVRFEPSRLRNLLKSLGVRFTLFWEAQTVIDKRTGEPRKSTRFFDLTRTEVTINGKHNSELFNNKYSHVHIPVRVQADLEADVRAVVRADQTP